MTRPLPAFYDHLSGFGVGPLPGPFSARGDVRYFPFLGHKSTLECLVKEYSDIANECNKTHSIELWQPSSEEEPNQPGGKSKDAGAGLEGGKGKGYALVMLCTSDFSLSRADSAAGIDEARSLYFRVPVVYRYGEGKTLNAYIELFPFHRTLSGVLTAKENRGLNATRADINVPRNQQLARSITRDSRRLSRRGSIYAENLLQAIPVKCSKLLNKDKGAAGKFRLVDNRCSLEEVIQGKTFLTLSTQVSDNVGQSVRMRSDVLLELSSIDDHEHNILSHNKSRVDPSSYWPEFIREVLAPILCDKKPETIIARKQIRDAYDQTRACYQSLVLLDAVYLKGKTGPSPDIQIHGRDGPGKVWRLKNACRLRIYKHYTHPIAEILGLEIDQANRLDPEFRALTIDTQGLPLVQKDVARVEERGMTICYRYDSGPYLPGEKEIQESVMIDGQVLER